jgi:hypothetical protein
VRRALVQRSELLDPWLSECSNDAAAENMLARKGFLVDSGRDKPASAWLVSLANQPART